MILFAFIDVGELILISAQIRLKNESGINTDNAGGHALCCIKGESGGNGKFRGSCLADNAIIKPNDGGRVFGISAVRAHLIYLKGIADIGVGLPLGSELKIPCGHYSVIGRLLAVGVFPTEEQIADL